MRSLIIVLTVTFIFSIPLITNAKNEAVAPKTANTSAEKSDIEYTYKKKEVFDFGELSIRGSVITPGDLTVKGQKRKQFRTEFTVRKDFDIETEQDIFQAGN
jgi:hypothetical protein